MRIAIGADHGGFELKEKLVEYLKSKKIDVMDFGTKNTLSCDYPPIGYEVGKAVSNGKCERGILICKTGVGFSIVANKVKGIRASVCQFEEVARSMREHNDCNVIVFGANFITLEEAQKCVDVWLEANISEDRHKKRVSQIEDIERKEFK